MPVCLAVSSVAFRKWLASAKPGTEFTYAVGRNLDRHHKVAQAARQAAKDGDVVLFHRRRPDGDFNYHARRVASAKPTAAPAHKTRALDPEGDAGRVLRFLDRYAEEGAPCPSNRTIALALRLNDGCRARYIVQQLERDGLITVENRGPRITRVITINASGKRTSDLRTPVGRGFHDEVRG